MTTPIYENVYTRHNFEKLKKKQKVSLDFDTKELALAKLLSLRSLCSKKTRESQGKKTFIAGITGRTVWYQRIK